MNYSDMHGQYAKTIKMLSNTNHDQFQNKLAKYNYNWIHLHTQSFHLRYAQDAFTRETVELTTLC
jgi:hypothetical protein